MSEITNTERKEVIRGFKYMEQGLSEVWQAFKDKGRLKEYSKGDYERFIEHMFLIFERSQYLAEYINKLDSDEPPFNLFKGDLGKAKHIIEANTLVGIRAEIENIKLNYFTEKGQRISDPPDLADPEYQFIVSMLRFSINCFKVFRKIASEKFVPREVKLKTVLDKVLADRQLLRHHTKFKFDIEVKPLSVLFDRDAIYWMAMRMLSNAEHATANIPNAWIKMQTYHHKDGNLYLIVRNNGETIEERAKGSAYRQGGKSMPNIKKICRMLGSDYKLKGFPDHTRACLMLPLAKKA